MKFIGVYTNLHIHFQARMCTPPLFNILIIFIKANDTIGSSPQLGVRPGASILGWQGLSRHPNENIGGGLGQTYLPPHPQ